jgi:hypothetical protein
MYINVCIINVYTLITFGRKELGATNIFSDGHGAIYQQQQAARRMRSATVQYTNMAFNVQKCKFNVERYVKAGGWRKLPSEDNYL